MYLVSAHVLTGEAVVYGGPVLLGSRAETVEGFPGVDHVQRPAVYRAHLQNQYSVITCAFTTNMASFSLLVSSPYLHPELFLVHWNTRNASACVWGGGTFQFEVCKIFPFLFWFVQLEMLCCLHLKFGYVS